MTIKQLFATAPITTVLLISFIGLFIIQLLTGVDANDPSTEQLLNWGANALPYTMGEDPWRLITSGFLHIGLMHLLFNSFAMYFFGQIAEPMFGSVKFLALFLLAVVGGNVLNNYVTWQAIIDGSGQPGLSAGASGGIMGIGAALLVAAFFKMSVNGMVLNLKSLIIIMGINLVYGFAVPGIDNAGHIGGAITGLLIALPIALAYRKRELAQQAAMAQAQQAYQNAVQASYASNHQPSYQTGLQDNQRDNPPLTNIFADNNSQTPVDLNNTADTADFDQSGGYINNYPTYIDPKKFAPEPVNVSLIWRLLPWLVMVVIVIGFLWWWQDIHQQILQVLKAIE